MYKHPHKKTENSQSNVQINSSDPETRSDETKVETKNEKNIMKENESISNDISKESSFEEIIHNQKLLSSKENNEQKPLYQQQQQQSLTEGEKDKLFTWNEVQEIKKNALQQGLLESQVLVSSLPELQEKYNQQLKRNHQLLILLEQSHLTLLALSEQTSAHPPSLIKKESKKTLLEKTQSESSLLLQSNQTNSIVQKCHQLVSRTVEELGNTQSKMEKEIESLNYQITEKNLILKSLTDELNSKKSENLHLINLCESLIQHIELSKNNST